MIIDRRLMMIRSSEFTWVSDAICNFNSSGRDSYDMEASGRDGLDLNVD